MAKKGSTKSKTVTQRPDTNAISVVSLLNRYGVYPSQGLDPIRLAEICREADQGDVFRQSQLYEEMLEKDLHLFGVFQTRKLAVTKRAVEIVPASDSAQHIEHAAFIKELFANIKNLNEARGDILDAVPKGFSVSQIHWSVRGGVLGVDKLEYVHQKNFRFGMGSDPLSDLNQIRRITDSNMVDGFELEPNKWIVSIIRARSGIPSRTSLMRTCTWMYLFKNFDIRAWIQFAEVFAMPLRLGKYSPNATDSEKADLLKALQSIALDASAMISEKTKIEFVESIGKAASAAIHNDLAEFCNAEMTKGVLGHTSAADAAPGKLGTDKTAEDIRIDLVQSDARAHDEILNAQLIRPAIDFQFGPQAAYPRCQTIVEPPKDRKELVEVYDYALNKLGMPLGLKTTYDSLGLPIPTDGEEVLLPRPPQQLPVETNPQVVGSLFACGKKKSLKNFNDLLYQERIDAMVEEAIRQSNPAIGALLATISGYIENAGGYADAMILDAPGASPSFIKRFSTLLFESIHTADACGRSLIVDMDRHYSGMINTKAARMQVGKYIVTHKGLNWFAAAGSSVRISFDLAPEDAVAAMRERAFWITGISLQELLDRIKDKIIASMQDGKPFADFKKEVSQLLFDYGDGNADTYRLATVFRTNIFSAYAAAQMEQVERIKDRFPMWRYIAVLDSRTRPEHARLNGIIFPRGEGPFPPIDYNCRCMAQWIHVYEAQRDLLKPVNSNRAAEIKNEFGVIDPLKGLEKWLQERKGSVSRSIQAVITSQI